MKIEEDLEDLRKMCEEQENIENMQKLNPIHNILSNLNDLIDSATCLTSRCIDSKDLDSREYALSKEVTKSCIEMLDIFEQYFSCDSHFKK